MKETGNCIIPQASLRLYNSVYEFNFQTQEYTELKCVEYFKQATSHITKAFDLIHAFITLCLVPEDHLRAHKFLDIQTLQARMDGQQFITQDFCSVRSGWIRIYLVPSQINEAGIITDAMLYTQNLFAASTDNLDICKQAPLQAFEERSTLSQITKTLYGFNLTVDVERGTYRLIVGTGLGRTVQTFLSNSDYTRALSSCKTYLHPAYAEKVNALTELQTLQNTESFGFIGRIEFPVLYPETTRYEWHELNVFLEKDSSGKKIANLLGRDVTKEHEDKERSLREMKSVAYKNRVLSDITKILYSFNISLNLKSGKYTLIEGNYLTYFVEILRSTDDYATAFSLIKHHVLPEYQDDLTAIAGLYSLKAHSSSRGFIGRLEYGVHLPAGDEWHEVNVFISTDEMGQPIANILGRNITESHLSTLQKEQAMRAAVEKDRLLSSITKILYKFNVTVNLKTWKYSIIMGENASAAIEELNEMDDYFLSYSILRKVVLPEQRPQLDALVGTEALLKVAHKTGYIGRVTCSTTVNNRQGWHDVYLFISTNEQGDPVANILVQDITETHQLREEQAQLAIAKAASEAKTSFLFNMSHDIRTPMNAIMGFTNLLEKYQDCPERRRDYLDKIKHSSHILLSLINNVLEMSRIEKGTLVLNENAWNTSSFNDTLYSVFHDMMHQKNIRFKRTVNVQHQYVFCDPIKLREIFINILSNAYKYTNPGGSVTMDVTEIPSPDKDYAMFQTVIRDTGIGMSEDFLPHLFEEFTREHTSTENKVEGTGLGMPIVKRLLNLMHGTVDVTSSPGEGTTFTVVVPHRIAQKSDVKTPDTCELEDISFDGHRLLLTEDNMLNAEIATELLQDFGFTIDLATDGMKCLEMLERKPAGYYDLILMDIQMPGINGYETTERIRTMADPEKSDIPIIAMTANAFEEDKQEAVNRGMNGHISKPINVPDLLTLISNVLNHRSTFII